MDEADGGGVGQDLGQAYVGIRGGGRLGAQEQQAAQALAAQPQRQHVGEAETGRPGPGRERRPGARVVVQVDGELGGGGPETGGGGAVCADGVQQARQGGGGSAGSDGVQGPAGRCEQDGGCGNVQQLFAAGAQVLEEVDDAEVVDDRVGEFHEGLGHQAFAVHGAHPPIR
ncbi:hypothetical protein ACH4FX_36245 [Streptomyces sp. NPDC018019]|uniref:hypothetical protein n=1 Tax=Streptomyces sp. NPDC018019 TaxID=3365030 RepID=UPI00379AAAD9